MTRIKYKVKSAVNQKSSPKGKFVHPLFASEQFGAEGRKYRHNYVNYITPVFSRCLRIIILDERLSHVMYKSL